MTAPTSLKYGKRAPKNAPALDFSRYLVPGATPTFPPVDNLKQIDWSETMNGNDSYGDCVACAVANTILLVSTVLGSAPVRATKDEVTAFYKTQNPGFDPNGSSDTNGPGSSHDGGMDIQTALEALVKDGITIGGKVYKALGFGKITPTSLPAVKGLVSALGSTLTGVVVDQVQQQQFPGVWSYVAESPEDGGHGIIVGGHSDVATRDLNGACWASEFEIADDFVEHQFDEVWGIIWEWHAGNKEFIEGMDLATLASDFTALTGAQFPVTVTPAPEPTPGPAPAPTPSPDPAPAPVADQADLKLWSSEARSWVYDHKHHGRDADLASSLSGWALEKGLPTGEHVPEHAVG